VGKPPRLAHWRLLKDEKGRWPRRLRVRYFRVLSLTLGAATRFLAAIRGASSSLPNVRCSGQPSHHPLRACRAPHRRCGFVRGRQLPSPYRDSAIRIVGGASEGPRPRACRVTLGTPVAALGSFNQLIDSGIVHPTGVLIVLFLAPVTGTSGSLGDSQWKSPFDTCPCTTSVQHQMLYAATQTEKPL
jgi:hypothetical protein